MNEHFHDEPQFQEVKKRVWDLARGGYDVELDAIIPPGRHNWRTVLQAVERQARSLPRWRSQVRKPVWSVGSTINDEFEVKRELGKGGMAKVFEVVRLRDKQIFAVKVALRSRRESQSGKRHGTLAERRFEENLLYEIAAWLTLRPNPHVVRCHFFRFFGDEIAVFLEYVHGPSLNDWLKVQHQELDLQKALTLAIHVARGMAWLHRHGVIHQDIKPRNILLDTSKGFHTAKISDFGIAQNRHTVRSNDTSSKKTVPCRGYDPVYASPEQRRGGSLSPATDVWTWALTTLTLLAGSPYWIKGQDKTRWPDTCNSLETHIGIPDDLKCLLRSCTAERPQDRPDSASVCEFLEEIYQQCFKSKCPNAPPPKDVEVSEEVGISNESLTRIDSIIGGPEIGAGIMAAKEAKDYLEALERVYAKHRDAEIKNIERLRTVPHPHTAAVCKALTALISAFPDNKIVAWIEAEISNLGQYARPEDVVVWIEDVGLFVFEVKSHSPDGIRSFENGVPQVAYRGNVFGDTDLLDQPRDFAYKLEGELRKHFDDNGKGPPPLYFSGWLPNVSRDDIDRLGAVLSEAQVWLSDMGNAEVILSRVAEMKNITRGGNVSRDALELICSVFGSTSGLRRTDPPRPTQFGSMGHQIDRKRMQLKKLTEEQEKLAFNPNLLRGPKVIRGVAGSGKTVVLANAVAEVYLRAMAERSSRKLFAALMTNELPKVLVLCYNRALAPYLSDLITECFDRRKPNADWTLPRNVLTVTNIDRLACQHLPPLVKYDPNKIDETVNVLNEKESLYHTFDHVFIDEGQDTKLAWYPWIRHLPIPDEEDSSSIVVFYDEAQNLYGVRRPGVGGTPPWRDLLGREPNPLGMRTVMRVGHRNTNQILSFSFSLLLGAFATRNPQMAQFAEINSWEKETIPDDAKIDHPNAGKRCVEKLDERQYRVNFAVSDGPVPNVHVIVSEEELVRNLVNQVRQTVDVNQGNVEPSNILIMVPERQNIVPIVQSLNNTGIHVHVPLKMAGAFGPGADGGCFQRGHVTVSTIKSAKGYTAPVCHVAFVHKLCRDNLPLDREQKDRAQLHVACTRSSLFLDVWGCHSDLMSEAAKARDAVAHQ